jgi:hypothetical protein
MPGPLEADSLPSICSPLSRNISADCSTKPSRVPCPAGLRPLLLAKQSCWRVSATFSQAHHWAIWALPAIAAPTGFSRHPQRASSGAGPPRVAVQNGPARFGTEKVEPGALAPRPIHVGFLVAPRAQPRCDRPPVAAKTRPGQLHCMPHRIVTPITHAPSTLDFCQHPRGTHIGPRLGRVKGNRYASQLLPAAVDIQSQDSMAPTSRITIEDR